MPPLTPVVCNDLEMREDWEFSLQQFWYDELLRAEKCWNLATKGEFDTFLVQVKRLKAPVLSLWIPVNLLLAEKKQIRQVLQGEFNFQPTELLIPDFKNFSRKNWRSPVVRGEIDVEGLVEWGEEGAYFMELLLCAVDNETRPLRDWGERKGLSMTGREKTVTFQTEGEGEVFEFFGVSHQNLILCKNLMQVRKGREESKFDVVLVCNSCQKNKASKFCQNERLHFCEECDQQHHSLGELLARHVRTPIETSPFLYGDCPLHPSVKIEHVCLTCMKFLCANCLLIGSHASFAMRQHQIVSSTDANLMRINQKFKANTRLAHVRSLFSLTQQNLMQFEIIIKKKIQQNLKNLHQIYKKLGTFLCQVRNQKLVLANSVRRNLFIQSALLEWLASFYILLRTSLPKDTFLFYARHFILLTDYFSLQDVCEWGSLPFWFWENLMLDGKFDVNVLHSAEESETSAEPKKNKVIKKKNWHPKFHMPLKISAEENSHQKKNYLQEFLTKEFYQPESWLEHFTSPELPSASLLSSPLLSSPPPALLSSPAPILPSPPLSSPSPPPTNTFSDDLLHYAKDVLRQIQNPEPPRPSITVLEPTQRESSPSLSPISPISPLPLSSPPSPISPLPPSPISPIPESLPQERSSLSSLPPPPPLLVRPPPPVTKALPKQLQKSSTLRIEEASSLNQSAESLRSRDSSRLKRKAPSSRPLPPPPPPSSPPPLPTSPPPPLNSTVRPGSSLPHSASSSSLPPPSK